MGGNRFTTAGAACTLVGDLTDIIDDARDVYTQLGARSYTVTVVRTRWSGGQRYMGVEQVIAETPILPTPAISSMTELERTTSEVGAQEEGTITVFEVSPRYSENELLGLDPDGTPIPEDENVFWEVRDVSGANVDSPRRRYVLASAPDYDELAFQWSLKLRRVQGDRTRLGEPSE